MKRLYLHFAVLHSFIFRVKISPCTEEILLSNLLIDAHFAIRGILLDNTNVSALWSPAFPVGFLLEVGLLREDRLFNVNFTKGFRAFFSKLQYTSKKRQSDLFCPLFCHLKYLQDGPEIAISCFILFLNARKMRECGWI